MSRGDDIGNHLHRQREYQMNAEQNLLHQCLSLGFDLPYFCWHPALGSVGACRQCAIKQFKDEHDTEGRIVMACMTPAAEGTRISINDPEAVAFRAGIIEGLMLNHPHDCPVCDEGGECHLQDMTVMTGHDYRRYRFTKRTFRNQYLGPFLNHEMNRCIQCYRCVRFYREYAGGADFNAFGLRDPVYFGREQDGVLENEFAGNLVEVCPTGRIHGCNAEAPLHAEMGLAARAFPVCPLRPRVQHQHRRALRNAAAGPEPISTAK